MTSPGSTSSFSFREYQDCVDERHDKRSTPEEWHLLYLSNALCGEVGELANYVKKQYRDSVTHSKAIALEIGDVLNYLTALASSMGFDMATIADMNLRKTAWRITRDSVTI